MGRVTASIGTSDGVDRRENADQSEQQDGERAAHVRSISPPFIRTATLSTCSSRYPIRRASLKKFAFADRADPAQVRPPRAAASKDGC